MRRDILTSLIAAVVFTILLGLVYPLLITGVSQVAFPGNANGQKIEVNGKLVGSKLIGQSFTSNPRYFQSRPSATEGGEYNAAASAFSNRGPNGRATAQADTENINKYLALNRPYDSALMVARIPVDAVNTSASNLDPEISQANAWIQAHRVAAKRGLSLNVVDRLISKHTSGRGLGFSGERGVNVLELNLALDGGSR
ncbi:MAG TPA: potassium-transporting ATPase subunit KdpC [Solirubrobacteraceae bacterium]|nr:potassium-transporting ATPase subunit KdpC [Solirubrobacteraceae bacterium]